MAGVEISERVREVGTGPARESMPLQRVQPQRQRGPARRKQNRDKRGDLHRHPDRNDGPPDPNAIPLDHAPPECGDAKQGRTAVGIIQQA